MLSSWISAVRLRFRAVDDGSCGLGFGPVRFRASAIKPVMVVSDIMRDSAVKQNSNALAQIARYTITLGAAIYCDEVISHWSRNVNPLELQVPPSFFENAVVILAGYSLLITAVTKAALTSEDAKVNMRPTPDTSNVITKTHMQNLAKDVSRLKQLEDQLKKIRTDYEPKIIKRLGKEEARMMLNMLEVNIARLAMGLPSDGKFPTGVAGKYSIEKMKKMVAHFYEFLDGNSEATKGIALECGFEIEDEDDSEKIDFDEVIMVSNFEKHEMTTTPEAEMLVRGFMLNMNVILKRRITVLFTYEFKGKEKSHRADIDKDTVVVLSGFIGESPDIMPVIKVEHTVDGAVREVLHKVSDKVIEAYKPRGPTDEPPRKRAKRNNQIAYVHDVGGEDDEIVQFKDWPRMIERESLTRDLNKAVLRFGMGLAYQEAKLPKADDITIITRNGGKQVECWANVDFKPGTLMLVAESSEIKDFG